MDLYAVLIPIISIILSTWILRLNLCKNRHNYYQGIRLVLVALNGGHPFRFKEITSLSPMQAYKSKNRRDLLMAVLIPDDVI